MTRESLAEIFVTYGDDAEPALAAWANLDPEAWSTYVDVAAEFRYHLDYAKWRRAMVRSAKAEAVQKQTGQARLFEMPESEAKVELRSKLVLDGVEHDLAGLAGDKGADIIRLVAERDLSPALTTVNRCRTLLRLADHMDAEAERLGRDVSAGEVLGWAA